MSGTEWTGFQKKEIMCWCSGCDEKPYYTRYGIFVYPYKELKGDSATYKYRELFEFAGLVSPPPETRKSVLENLENVSYDFSDTDVVINSNRFRISEKTDSVYFYSPDAPYGNFFYGFFVNGALLFNMKTGDMAMIKPPPSGCRYISTGDLRIIQWKVARK